MTVQIVTPEQCKAGACGRGPHVVSKFSSCFDEAVYQWAIEYPDQETGSVEWHYHLVMLQVKLDPMIIPVAEEDDPWYVNVPVGTYLVYTRDSGAVTVNHYKNHSDAEEAFNEDNDDYSRWDDPEAYYAPDPDDREGAWM